jgi:hypothetical protein
MCHALSPGTEVTLDFHLVCALLEPSPYRDKVRARVLIFSREQRNVIADFLSADSHYGTQTPCPYRRAIIDFWDPDTGLQGETNGG